MASALLRSPPSFAARAGAAWAGLVNVSKSVKVIADSMNRETVFAPRIPCPP
jgi:hypothetical protein